MALTPDEIKSVAIKVSFDKILIEQEKTLKKYITHIDFILECVKKFKNIDFYCVKAAGYASYGEDVYETFCDFDVGDWPYGLYEYLEVNSKNNVHFNSLIILDEKNDFFMEAFKRFAERGTPKIKITKNSLGLMNVGFEEVYNAYFGKIKSKPLDSKSNNCDDIIEEVCRRGSLVKENKNYLKYLIDVCGNFPFFKVSGGYDHELESYHVYLSEDGENGEDGEDDENGEDGEPMPIHDLLFYASNLLFDYFDFFYLIDKPSTLPGWISKHEKVDKYLDKVKIKPLDDDDALALVELLTKELLFRYAVNPSTKVRIFNVLEKVYNKNKNKLSVNLRIAYLIRKKVAKRINNQFVVENLTYINRTLSLISGKLRILGDSYFAETHWTAWTFNMVKSYNRPGKMKEKAFKKVVRGLLSLSEKLNGKKEKKDVIETFLRVVEANLWYLQKNEKFKKVLTKKVELLRKSKEFREIVDSRSFNYLK